MIILILVVVIVGSAFWVYLDATKNKIGKITGAKGMFNMSAGGWAAVTLLLWIIGLPAYAVKRAELIERAKQTPVDVKNRAVGFVVLSFAGVGWIGFGLLGHLTGTLPACDAPVVVKLVEDVVRGAPAVKLLGVEVMGIKDAGEMAYSADDEKRTCRAMLTSAAGQEVVKYTVEWQNKTKGLIWVQIVQ